jgi:Flp pilus assembly protein TadD
VDDRLGKASGNRQLATEANRFKERIAAVEGEVYQVRMQASQDPLNYPIKLNNQLAALRGVIESADARPTAQSGEAFTVLSDLLEVQLTSLQKIFDEDLKKLNVRLKALGLDPGFARAHAALASAYVVLPGYTEEEGDEEKFRPLAVASARQALSIDPNIGEAHAVLAQINAQRGNLLDAESGFFFAISLEPNEPTPHHWYSLLLAQVGRIGAAREQARRAQELDPTSPVLAANLAGMYLMLGEDEQAMRFSNLAADLGLSKKQGGIESAVAMRRGQWDEARRLIAAQEDIPPELRPQGRNACVEPLPRLRRLRTGVLPVVRSVVVGIRHHPVVIAWQVVFGGAVHRRECRFRH